MNINFIFKALKSFRVSNNSCSQQSIVIAMLFQNDIISTVDLRDAGVMNPRQVIAILKKKGAVITSERKDAEDRCRRLYKNVCHYSLDGWED